MPPRPSSAMMRYRPASRRRGRKRPSLTAKAEELGGGDVAADGDRGGRGETATAMVASLSETRAGTLSDVSVAMSSEPTGAPRDAKNRLAIGSSTPQDRQKAMHFSADSVPRGGARRDH